MPKDPAKPQGKSDVMARAVYLAQLEAAKGKCKCKTCQILRRATDVMTKEFMGEVPAGMTSALTDPSAPEDKEG
jgi:hypothetical protein